MVRKINHPMEGHLGKVRYNPSNMKYHYGPFKGDRRIFMENPDFRWDVHIRDTFHKCMKPMTDRFMKVN
jgi:hypothetical protein